MTGGPLLVVGASGFLGRTLVQACTVASRPAVGLSRAECDVTDAGAVERAIAHHRPELVVNAAAFSKVDAAELDPEAAAAVNAEGPAILAARTAAAGIPLIHISTDYVFDGRKRTPYREGDPVAPLGHYGRTKADGEARVRVAQPRHVILRTAWLFGRSGGGFVSMAVAAALRRQPIRTIVDQTGSPTAAVDLAGAILAVDRAIGRGAVPWGTYHYAGREPARRLDVVETILAAVRALQRQTPSIVPVTAADLGGAAKTPNYSALDSSLFETTIHYPASDWRCRLVELVQEEAMATAAAPQVP
jgi:dTDP-4-dehydrorhamnose reductase